MRAVSTLLVMSLTLSVASIAFAADTPQTPNDQSARGPRMQGWDMFRGINLTDEQKAKIETIKQEYAPKFKEAADKLDGVLTEDQKKTRDEAIKTARASGKRGPEVRKEIHEAMKLTAEQETQLAEARKAVAAVHQEARTKMMEVLTPEQQEQVNQTRLQRGPRDGRGPQAGMGPRGMRGLQKPGFGGGPLACVTLTEEQKEQLKAIRAEYTPKIQEARDQIASLRKDMHEKVLAMLTPEQKTQMEQACPMQRGPRPMPNAEQVPQK